MKKRRSIQGFTIAEALIAVVIGGLALAAMFSGVMTLQRCLASGEEFAADKREQTRVSDYLAMDLRRAVTATPGDGLSNVILTLTIPDYYDNAGKPVTPSITKYTASYGAGTVQVVYRKLGTTITREEDGEAPVVIAKNVEDFQCPPQEKIGSKMMKTKVTFLPHFKRNAASGDAERQATTVYNLVKLRNIK